MSSADNEHSEQLNWLERMHPFLNWKIHYPEFSNPFGQPMSNKVLIEFATKKDVLMRHIELRGTVDGEEIIILRNITRDIEIVTNHPAVINMKKTQIKAYIDNSGILNKIDKEISAAQLRYRDELKVRKVKIPETE